jgi:alpha-tubulin suppressor-like RCC1 family protein
VQTSITNPSKALTLPIIRNLRASKAYATDRFNYLNPVNRRLQKTLVKLWSGKKITKSTSPVVSGDQYMKSQIHANSHTNLILIILAILGCISFSLSARASGPVTAWGRGAIFCSYCDSGQTYVPGDLTNAVAVAGGWNHSLALRADGTVSAWGLSSLGATSVPAGLSNVVAIAAGDNHSLALLSNGTVVAWGYNGNGQINVPAGLTNVVAIASGNYFNLALRNDGSVAAWGDNGNSQVSQAGSATGIKSISANSANTGYALGLKTDGTVVEWGLNQSPMPAGLTNIMSIAVGGAHYLALRSDGTVLAWGDNSSGQTNVPAGLSNVVAVAAGGAYSIALKSDGTVTAWGTSDYGLNTTPLGLTNVVAISGGGEHVLVIHDGAPSLLQWPTNQSIYTGMAAGFSAATAPTVSSSTFQWQFSGTNLPGATGTALNFTNAQVTDSGLYVFAVTNAYGSYHATFVLTVSTSSPVVIQQPVNQVVPATSNAVFSVSAIGSLPLSYQWLCNGTNLPAQTNTTLAWPAAQLGHSGLVFTVVVSNEFGTTLSSNADLTVLPSIVTIQPGNLTTNGGSQVTFTSSVAGQGPFTYQWLFNGTNLIGATDSQLTLTNALVIQSGNYSLIASNSFGSSTFTTASLTVVPWISISISPRTINVGAGSRVSFSFNVGGLSPVAYQWTQNGNPWAGPPPGGSAQIIDPQMSWAGVYNVTASDATTTLTSSNISLTINPLTITGQPTNQAAWTGGPARLSVAAIGVNPIEYQWQFNGADIAGATNSILVLTNVQPAQFGSYNVVLTNAYTNLISQVVTLTPSEVAVWGGASGETNLPLGLTNIMAISGGPADLLSCWALNSSGKAIGWPGSSVYSYLATNLVAIAGGGSGVGLRKNGTVAAPLYSVSLVPGLTNIAAIAPNYYGYLALMTNGTVIGSASKPGLTNIVAITEGNGHSLALKSDGTVAAWGNNNNYGQINIPPGLSNVVAIAAGFYHSLALRNDGTVVAWGNNNNGQTIIPSGLSNIVAIAAGGFHSLALRSDGTVMAWGMNTYGQTNVPPRLTNVVAIAAGQFQSLALIGNGPPVTQSTLSNPSASSNTFKLSLPTQSGKVYVLERKTSLSDTNWTSLPLVPGNGSTLILTDPTATNPQQFYRVRRW